jgi:hypothetical protein
MTAQSQDGGSSGSEQKFTQRADLSSRRERLANSVVSNV